MTSRAITGRTGTGPRQGTVGPPSGLIDALTCPAVRTGDLTDAASAISAHTPTVDR